MTKHSMRDEGAFTLIELLVGLVILTVLVSIGTVAYAKHREQVTDRTVQHDVRNYATFMKEEYLESGEFTEEISESFANWTKDNNLTLTEQGSCVVGTNPGYPSIFWRYSLIDNTVSRAPCPTPVEGEMPDLDPGDPVEEDEEEGEVGDNNATPPPGKPGDNIPPPPPPGDNEDDQLGFTPAYVITADPILFTGFNNQATNNLTLEKNGDLLVEGNFECNSNVKVTGTVVVTGNAYLTNNCLIEGNLWVGGDLRMNSTPHIKGDVQVKGDFSTQSTATIDGSVWTGGELTIIDGKTIGQLQEMGSIKGEVEQKIFIPKYEASEFPVNKVNGTLTSWSDWMKQQASYYNTPSWSPVAQGQGCIIAPGQNYSLPGDVQVNSSTNVDARSCNNIQFGAGGTVRLRADLTLFVNSFTATNGIHFVSDDGQPHRVNIVVPTAGDTPNRTCGNQGHIDMGSNSTGDENVHVVLYTESKVTLGGNARMSGEIMAGCTNMWGNVRLANPDGR